MTNTTAATKRIWAWQVEAVNEDGDFEAVAAYPRDAEEAFTVLDARAHVRQLEEEGYEARLVELTY